MTCVEHLSCALPVNPVVNVVERVGPGGGPYQSVEWDGRVLGTYGDRSWQTHDGRTVKRYAAFGGGNHLGDFDTEDAAVKAVKDNATRYASSWRAALHG